MINNEHLLIPYDPYLINWSLFLVVRSFLLLMIRIPLLLFALFIAVINFLFLVNEYRYIDLFMIKIFYLSFGFNLTIENLKNDKTYFPKIIMSNHTSIFDTFIIYYTLTLYKAKYIFVISEFTSKSFFLSWVCKKNKDYIIIIKGQSTVEKIRNCFLTNNNKSVVIYPEGRHTNGKFISTFHTGGFLHNKDIQPILITSDSLFLNENSIKNGSFGMGMKHFKTPDYKYLIMYLFRIMINPSINATIKLLPIFKKEEYLDDPEKTADKLRDILLTHEKRMKKLDSIKLY